MVLDDGRPGGCGRSQGGHHRRSGAVDATTRAAVARTQNCTTRARRYGSTNVLAGVAGAAAVAALVLVFFTDFGAEQPEQDDEDATVAAWPGGLVVTW